MEYNKVTKKELQSERLIPRNQVAELLGIKPITLYVWIKRGTFNLPTYKIGNRYHYRLVDVQAYINDSEIK
ncbi:helix-turn-helix transcriptional regulator [Photobacterium rosenbergii]|nr:helix-turn-helix domain-containing protein [Photobacterium rosenbergii]